MYIIEQFRMLAAVMASFIVGLVLGLLLGRQMNLVGEVATYSVYTVNYSQQ